MWNGDGADESARECGNGEWSGTEGGTVIRAYRARSRAGGAEIHRS